MLDAIAPEYNDVTLPATEELLPEGRLRRDDKNVAACIPNLRAAAPWGEEVERLDVSRFLPAFEGNDRAEIYRVMRAEVA